MAAAQASPDFSFPAPDPAVFGLSGPDYEWVKRRQTPHPGHTYDAPLNFDPVRVAEDYATIDLLSGGRVEPVIGRGTFFPHTFASFGQDPATAKEVFAENLELLLRIWETDGPVTWTGRFRAPLHEISVEPRPMQRPRPHVWLGAGSSKDSVELAARLGLSRAELLRDLRLEKTAQFGQTPLYARVFSLADSAAGSPVSREALPQIDLKSPKIQRKLTTGWFAERVDARHRTCLGRDRSTLP